MHVCWKNVMPVFIAAITLMAAMVMACLGAISAHAHHPGSHAWRQSGTDQVRLESVAMVTDGCTFIGAVTPGAPGGQAMPQGDFAVTVRLRRPADAQICTTQVKTIKDETRIAIPSSFSRIHLFIVKPDGALLSTERVPIR